MTHFTALCATYALPKNESLRLAAFALAKPRTWFLAHDRDVLAAAQIAALHAVFSRRAAGEPVAYIEGVREFYGLDFKVSPAVLIPRAETELLVQTVIELAQPQGRILDLGTGSGAIAVACAHARPDCTVFASDVSHDALAIARHNAAAHAPRVAFFQGSWFEALPAGTTPFDCIVSNPPYIAAGDAHLAQGDLRHEPAGALTDFADGLAHYRIIAAQAKDWLAPQGWLIFEHGYDQGEAVCGLLRGLGYGQVVQHFDDDQQRQARMVVARKG
jgi:release factor glutamine methyltransferase